MRWYQNSNGEPDHATESSHAGSRFTPTFHRCLGHVTSSIAKHGYPYPKGTEYAICTTSIGYAGSYTGEHRQGARTPKGRAKKMGK